MAHFLSQHIFFIFEPVDSKRIYLILSFMLISLNVKELYSGHGRFSILFCDILSHVFFFFFFLLLLLLLLLFSLIRL